MRAPRKWTPAEDDRLRGLVAAGASQSQIGRLMGRTTASVSGRITNLVRAGMMTRTADHAPVSADLDPIDERVVRLCNRYGWRGWETLP